MKAKTLILVSLFFFSLASHQVFSQQISGRAIYKASNQLVFNLDSAEMSPTEMSEMEEMMKKPWESNFILTFTQTESNWKQFESLGNETANPASDGMTINLGGNGDEILYKNLMNQRFVQEQEFMGKMFLIEDSLDPIEWDLTNETRKIGNYTAQKASFSLIVDAQQFSTGMAEMENVKDTIEVIAWFTPEIPVSHGPENYFGLPGLILEVHNGGRSFYCEKIELNPVADPIFIQIPKKGKTVNREEFSTMQEKSMKEMIDRYQGKPGEKSKVRIGG